MIALHLRQPTFSFKKITAPKTTTSGVACNIAEAFDIGIKAIAMHKILSHQFQILNELKE